MLDDLDLWVDLGGLHYIVVQLLRSAMYEDAPRGNALLLLDVCEITSKLIYCRHCRLSLLAFDNDGMIVPVKQDYVGAGTVLKRQFANLECRMNSKAVLKMMRIGRNVTGEGFLVIESREETLPIGGVVHRGFQIVDRLRSDLGDGRA